MIKILITGGAGNIGASLARRLVQNPNYFVVIADNLLTGDVKKLPPATSKNWRFIKCDINDFQDISAIMTSFSFDYVFHYAAVVGVQRTLQNPTLVLRDIDGIKHILSLSKNTSVRRVFYSSSSEVYGEPTEHPQNENTTPLNSRLPYAIVKNLGEAYFRSYHQEFGLNYTIFRFFNTYGPLQSADFVISRFVDSALRDEPLIVNGDGSQTRTFCYINDNLEFTVACLENECFINDVVNVGSDVEMSIKELANRVINVLGSKSTIVHKPPLREGDMARRRPDISKMRSVLKRELTTLDEGILAMKKFKSDN